MLKKYSPSSKLSILEPPRSPHYDQRNISFALPILSSKEVDEANSIRNSMTGTSPKKRLNSSPSRSPNKRTKRVSFDNTLSVIANGKSINAKYYFI